MNDPNAPGRKINLLWVLDHESPVDLEWRRCLSKHLVLCKREGLFAERIPFSLPEDEVERCASEAEVVLFLVSPDSIAMENTKLLDRCLELYEQKSFPRIVPIVLRECDWKKNKRYGGLTELPREKGPVAKWSDGDAALASVARDVRFLLETLRAKPRAVPLPKEHELWG